MVESGVDLLRRLGASDESALSTVLTLPTEPGRGCTRFDGALTMKIRILVRLAALLALDASTTSIRWAAEQAGCAGADIDEITAVLVAVAPDVGAPRVVAGAPRLALAVGYDVGVESSDEA
jgi:4-carboxymuconolactone decarboxylase